MAVARIKTSRSGARTPKAQGTASLTKETPRRASAPKKVSASPRVAAAKPRKIATSPAGSVRAKVKKETSAEGPPRSRKSEGFSVAKAPSFSLKDGAGDVVTSASLKGKPYVIYFYPKDNTPGCTQEACDFRDNYSALRKLGVEVFGVSPDSAKSHQGFAEKHGLPFRLLVDDEKQLATALGVWAMKKNYGREFMGIVRSTFLVDRDGKIRAEWRGVRVAGHAAAVLAEAKKVANS